MYCIEHICPMKRNALWRKNPKSTQESFDQHSRRLFQKDGPNPKDMAISNWVHISETPCTITALKFHQESICTRIQILHVTDIILIYRLSSLLWSYITPQFWQINSVDRLWFESFYSPHGQATAFNSETFWTWKSHQLLICTSDHDILLNFSMSTACPWSRQQQSVVDNIHETFSIRSVRGIQNNWRNRCLFTAR